MKKLWRNINRTLQENFFNEQFRLLGVVPFLFASGIALYFSLPFETDIWFSLGILEIWLLLFYICRYKNLHYFFIGGLIVIMGYLDIQAHSIYQSKHIEKITEQKLTYIKGQIRNITNSAKDKTRVELQHAEDYDNPLKGKFRITIGSDLPDNLEINQCIEMVATLFPNRRIPVKDGFPLDRKYFYESLSATGFANSEIFTIKCPNTIPENSFISSINNLRRKITTYISNILPRNNAGIADALIVGEKSYISPQITDNYRNSGLAHFLSVSGLHLGTIAALVFFVIRFLIALFPFIALRVDSKKIAAVCAIMFSALYLLISGMAIPAQRAFIMTTVVLIGVVFNRQAVSIRMVNFAALIVLIIEPQTLISVSFQMSFAAVYALVAFYEAFSTKLANYAPKHNIVMKIIWYLCGIVIGDFIASMATLPLSLYHFHRVAVYTSLGNLLAGPLIALWLMPMVLVCLATLPFQLAYYPLKALGYGLDILNNITEYVSHLPHSIWYNNNLSFCALMMIVCGGYWICIWQQPWRRWGIIPIILAIPTIFIGHKQPDMVFSPNAAEIAVRNKNNKIQILPYKKNSWLEQIWRENIRAEIPEKSVSQQFRDGIKSENYKDIDELQLLCNNLNCTYRKTVEFVPNKMININGQEIDISVGGYIYLGKNTKVEPLDNKNTCRIWQNCQQK